MAFKPFCFTMMTPVSLLAIMTEMRQVLGRTAAIISSTSTRAFTLETGTHVTSRVEITGSRFISVVKGQQSKPKQPSMWKEDHPPAFPTDCRCLAVSLMESCSTLEVMMCGRPEQPFCSPSPCSAALRLFLKCSTAVCSTRLLAYEMIHSL